MLAVALGCLFAAGLGAAMLVLPARGRAVERAGLAVFLGSGFVAVASWLLGYFVRGWPLRLAVAGACLALLAAGTLRARARASSAAAPAVPFDSDLAVFLAFAAAHTAGLRAILSRTQPGWDGFLVWEFKARIAALAGGVMPIDYFGDASRTWTHPYYPPLHALVTAWIYGWSGGPDAQLSKALLPALHGALLVMLYAGGRRLGGRIAGFAAPLLFVAIPEVTFADGSFASGLLDTTIGAYYLPAALYLALLWSGDETAVAPLAAVCAALPLVKQEGVVLWGVVATLAAIAIVRRHPRRYLWALVPGLVLFLGWRLHLVLAGTPPNENFTPTLANLLAHLDRVPVIFGELWVELARWRAWGLLWPGVVLAVPFLVGRRRTDVVLLVALAAPVLVLSASYVVTNWDLVTHVRGSLGRLLMQVAPVGALIVALGIPSATVRMESRADA